MQQIRPANPVAPSFVYVDVVVLNMIFLSDLCAQRLDQFVVHVVRKIIGGKFVAHQSLTENKKTARGGSKHSISSKEKRRPEKHLNNLETHDDAEVDNEVPLPGPCCSNVG